jgi:hypothetical protein
MFLPLTKLPNASSLKAWHGAPPRPRTAWSLGALRFLRCHASGRLRSPATFAASKRCRTMLDVSSLHSSPANQIYKEFPDIFGADAITHDLPRSVTRVQVKLATKADAKKHSPAVVKEWPKDMKEMSGVLKAMLEEHSAAQYSETKCLHVLWKNRCLSISRRLRMNRGSS